MKRRERKRNDDVFINAPAALNAMAAKGFLKAVRCIVKNTKNLKSEV